MSDMIEIEENPVKTVEEKPMKSPCVSICLLNDDDVCVGCYRTGEEITEWGAYSNDERREVLVRSHERGKALNPFL